MNKITLKKDGQFTLNGHEIPGLIAFKIDKKSSDDLATITISLDVSEVNVEVGRNDFEW